MVDVSQTLLSDAWWEAGARAHGCNARVDVGGMMLDEIKPLSAGGGHELADILALPVAIRLHTHQGHISGCQQLRRPSEACYGGGGGGGRAGRIEPT